MKQQQLTEGIDYYYNEDGYVVLTAKYHLEKGYCCGNGCRHCPYDFENVPEPKRSKLKHEQAENKKTNAVSKGPDC
jgi:2-iminoacetate synthase ThiH